MERAEHRTRLSEVNHRWAEFLVLGSGVLEKCKPLPPELMISLNTEKHLFGKIFAFSTNHNLYRFLNGIPPSLQHLADMIFDRHILKQGQKLSIRT